MGNWTLNLAYVKLEMDDVYIRYEYKSDQMGN